MKSKVTKRIFDNQGRIIWYDGVLLGNCPKCGQSLDNVALGIHRCSPPKNVIFKHAMSGHKQFGGKPIQETFCSLCGKVRIGCGCPR